VTFRTNKTMRAACTLALVCGGFNVSADRVVLNNGDALSGEIVERTETAITLRHAVLGDLVLPIERVRKVEAEAAGSERDTSAEAEGNTESTPGETDEAAPDAEAIEHDAKQAADANLSPTEQFLRDWESTLTLGLNGASGNSDTQDYRVGLRTHYQEGRDRWKVDTDWYYATADGRKTRNRFSTDVVRDWLQEDSPWFFFLKGSYTYDENHNWLNRTSGFGGGGYTLANNDKVELTTRVGFGGTYEYGDVNEFTPEALFGGSAVDWRMTDRSTVNGDVIYYPSLEEESAFRVESILQWRYKLDSERKMSLNLGIENEYDSRTPNDPNNNDFKYFATVSFEF